MQNNKGDQRPLKILFLAPQPFFEERGTPINVKLVLTALSELGHQVTMVTLPFGDDVAIPNVDIKRIPPVWGVGKPPIGPSLPKIIYDAVMLVYVLFHRLFNKYDAVHAVEESVFIARGVNTFFGDPYVFDMDSHMTDQLRYAKFAKREWLFRFFEWLEIGTLKQATVVLTVCKGLSDVARRYVQDHRIVQAEDIPQQFPPAPQGVTPDSLRAELGIDPVAPVALYTGNFEAYQGINLLMESMALVAEKNRDVVFVIVGGNPHEVDRYKERSRMAGFADSVRFTGKKPLSHMPVYYEMADILLSPRLDGTNTPLKIYTYLATAKAIVATDLPTHTQLLTSEVAQLARPEKIAYATAILLLLNDPGTRLSLGKRGAAFVQEEFHYDRFKEKIAATYAIVVERPLRG